MFVVLPVERTGGDASLISRAHRLPHWSRLPRGINSRLFFFVLCCSIVSRVYISNSEYFMDRGFTVFAEELFVQNLLLLVSSFLPIRCVESYQTGIGRSTI